MHILMGVIMHKSIFVSKNVDECMYLFTSNFREGTPGWRHHALRSYHLMCVHVREREREGERERGREGEREAEKEGDR